MKALNKLNLLTDFYELSMGNGFLQTGHEDTIVYFDVYFRRIPDDGGYAIFAGLENVVDYIENLSFDEDEISYLRENHNLSEEYLDYLKNFEFKCDIWSFEEGETVYPNEPLMIIRGPIIQVQLMETLILLTLNHQSLIATKTRRIVNAAEGRAVSEFGSRRAQGYSASLYGARASYIGGAIGTSNTLAGKMFDIPALGTMAHSWVQFFDSEYEAFKAYAETYPENCNLLIDTYDVLKEGLPNAIKVFDEIVVPSGHRPTGVRIDSGDIAYLSKQIRITLDAHGYEDVKIMVSNSLDEKIIKSLLDQGAQIDSFGVGERLITAKSDPVFGGVYKLVAVEKDGEIIPKIKISENVEKITTPGFKQVYRFYSNKDGAPLADLVCLHDEKYENTDSVEIFHPNFTWKRRTLTDYQAVKMLKRIYKDGKLVYKLPSLDQIKEKSEKSVARLWEEQKRLEYPHEYYVDLSLDLWTLKDDLLKKKR